jgi:4-hydroxyphenylpyruvate dioxygenase
MELHIPGIHGVGDSLIYFVDRYRISPSTTSISCRSDTPGTARARRPALVRRGAGDPAGAHADWLDFYRTLLGFTVLPHGKYFGVLPKGTLLESPCHKFYLQLIEPPAGADANALGRRLVRVGLGAPDVPQAVSALQSAAWCSSTAAACSRARKAPSPSLTSAAPPSSWS